MKKETTNAPGIIGQLYEDRKTRRVGKLISRDEKFKTMMFEEEDGSAFVISNSTFRSNYRKVLTEAPVEEVKEEVVATEVVEEVPKEEVKKPAEKKKAKAPKQKKEKSETKPKTEKKEKVVEELKPLDLSIANEAFLPVLETTLRTLDSVLTDAEREQFFVWNSTFGVTVVYKPDKNSRHFTLRKFESSAVEVSVPKKLVDDSEVPFEMSLETNDYFVYDVEDHEVETICKFLVNTILNYRKEVA